MTIATTRRVLALLVTLAGLTAPSDRALGADVLLTGKRLSLTPRSRSAI